MTRIFLFVMLTFSGIFFASLPTQAGPVCLEPGWNNTYSYWVNKCDFNVYVNWDDGASCNDYSCAGDVAANSRSPATISRKNELQWCEFHNGKSGRCNQSGASQSGASNSATLPGAASSGGAGNTRIVASSADVAKYGNCVNDPARRAELDKQYASGAFYQFEHSIAGLFDLIAWFGPNSSPSDKAWQRVVSLSEVCG